MTQQALLGLVIFLVLVMVYLVVRFEWRMAVAAVASLLLDLVLTAGVYSLVGFEVTPSTVIGFLTILGFSLYDVVVVFDKVQENTRGITASSTQTYSEAANLAVNQTLMRSINTGLVALLPVGGLLFIGAGLLGAGTLKDLGLVLFVGMGLRRLLLDLVRGAGAGGAQGPGAADQGAHRAGPGPAGRRSAHGDVRRAASVAARRTRPRPTRSPALAGATPRPGARPAAKRNANRGGRPAARATGPAAAEAPLSHVRHQDGPPTARWRRRRPV